MQSTCFFRHALALHERRVKFLPEYVNGGLGPIVVDTLRGPNGTSDPRAVRAAAQPMTVLATQTAASDQPIAQKEDSRPHTKEVWFAGCHSDM